MTVEKIPHRLDLLEIPVGDDFITERIRLQLGRMLALALHVSLFS